MSDMAGGSLEDGSHLSVEDKARQRWLAVLAKASLAELEAARDALPEMPRFRVLRSGESGLVMVRGRIGGTGQAFNLGEMTMTRAAVQLLDDSGGVIHTGFGHVAGRSPQRAELVALLDALLQDRRWHQRIDACVIAPLAAAQEAAKSAQAAKVGATKVDFFTMVRGE
ncbi:MAG TPA: phosphonate C-P lyase system protein PhnG [Stellaceae bacterium]|jgi:alpha-D-ribose 1-methylphosphonate 5-triphosphate synthase subunit PhnG|nr:phosphonate C-P lyase system protein PhnG [Stellaceae bacterium]